MLTARLYAYKPMKVKHVHYGMRIPKEIEETPKSPSQKEHKFTRKEVTSSSFVPCLFLKQTKPPQQTEVLT